MFPLPNEYWEVSFPKQNDRVKQCHNDDGYRQCLIPLITNGAIYNQSVLENIISYSNQYDMKTNDN